MACIVSASHLSEHVSCHVIADHVKKGLLEHAANHIASAAGKSVSKEAESSMTGCRIEVSISLRAFVPTVSAASAAVAIRMAERWTRYEQYSTYWQVRPRVSSATDLPTCTFRVVSAQVSTTVCCSSLGGAAL